MALHPMTFAALAVAAQVALSLPTAPMDLQLSLPQDDLASIEPQPEVVVQPGYADSTFPGTTTPYLGSLLSPELVVAGAQQVYRRTDLFAGNNFFDQFDFETSEHFVQSSYKRPDPTNGYVNYVDRGTATAQGLIRISAQNRTEIYVDSTNIATGYGRQSVRLRSKKAWHTGLFVADVKHIPAGQGVWPALWTVGPEGTWPGTGEIDIIEGVNDQPTTASTLHTSPQCDMRGTDTRGKMTASGYYNTDCNAGTAFVGCGVGGPQASFGSAFNAPDGGTFAAEWTDTFIRAWYWPRGASPMETDPASQPAAPTPDQWGTPYAYWTLGGNCQPSHFGMHNLIINTAVCGDWAGAGWQQQCVDHARNNPAAFAEAYWKINYVSVYQRSS